MSFLRSIFVTIVYALFVAVYTCSGYYFDIIPNGTPNAPTPAPSTSFGQGNCAVGDVNLDGIDDIMIGAAYAGTGQIYLLFMGSSEIISSHLFDENTVNFDYTLRAGFAEFGGSCTNVGDLNGDNVPDVAVGAIRALSGEKGAVYTLLLKSDGTLLSSREMGSGVGGFPTISTNTHFGGTLASIDIDSDGKLEILTAAVFDNSGCAECSAVYVIWVNSIGEYETHYKISRLTTQPVSAGSSHFFGRGLEGMPDMNEDTVPDILAGAPNGGTAFSSVSGVIYILFMNTDGSVKDHVEYSANTLSDAFISLSRTAGSVTYMGDLANIGDNTFAVAAGGAWESAQNGVILILFINADDFTANRFLHIREGSNGLDDGYTIAGSFFGQFVRNAGDVNHDGVPDLLVSSSKMDAGLDGKATILFMTALGKVAVCENGGIYGLYSCDCSGTEFIYPTCHGDCQPGVKVSENECDCGDSGTYGPTCQYDIDDCASSPCLNDQPCYDNGTHSYICDCGSSGWEGPECQNNIDECLALKCKNNATCTDWGPNNFTCNCDGTGYDGKFCTKDVDDCESSPCVNGGSCTDEGTNVFSCVCISGYTGTDCSLDVDDCASDPCFNNGTCTDLGLHRYNCTCAVGHDGDLCQRDVDDCASSPCQNGGSCADLGANMFECDCPAKKGYEGVFCTDDIDDCKNDPCENGGTCYDRGVKAYECECAPGYTGVDCELSVDDCLSSPCFNGASCMDAGLNAYSCNCEGTGWTGEFCTERIDDCASNPCLNGGACLDDIDTFTCNCSSAIGGYNGTRCETSWCESDPCLNSGECLLDDPTTMCDCSKTDYTGILCEILNVVEDPPPINVEDVRVTIELDIIKESSDTVETVETELADIILPAVLGEAEDYSVEVVDMGDEYQVTIVYYTADAASAAEDVILIEEHPDLADRVKDARIASVVVTDEEEDGCVRVTHTLQVIAMTILFLLYTM